MKRILARQPTARLQTMRSMLAALEVRLPRAIMVARTTAPDGAASYAGIVRSCIRDIETDCAANVEHLAKRARTALAAALALDSSTPDVTLAAG